MAKSHTMCLIFEKAWRYVVGDAVDSAASKVFNIPELLEAVLLDLSCKDVLITQRVSKLWKATIDGSAKLQKALCFVPVQKCKKESAALDAYCVPIFSDSTSARDFYCDSHANNALYNPFLKALFRSYIPVHSSVPLEVHFEYNSGFHNFFQGGKNSSLRKMLVVQPAMTRVRVDCIEEYATGKDESGRPLVKHNDVNRAIMRYYLRYIENTNGVTVGDVVDQIEKECFPTFKTSFYFRVVRCN